MAALYGTFCGDALDRDVVLGATPVGPTVPLDAPDRDPNDAMDRQGRPRPRLMPTAPPPADDPALDNAPDENGDSPIEEAARQQFGIRRWERPALYRETAEAATDTDLPFWAVLLLSGAIATLGLTLNSTAVVIGAMLVAPLLGPLLGLSLALAVGDGRLFVQTATTIFLGAAGIIALAALLTAVLPFQTVTDEIAARTRPTTLDLAIAVCSGLAGAVVTASREKRLSASIPGVAVAVALVPPLGVAGFGIGTGMQWPIIRGSLLLFGANLAGIVLSGLLVFLLIGMQRADVLKAARQWHHEDHATGLASRLEGLGVLDRFSALSTPWTRAFLVVAFMAVVAVPLTSSLRQIVRESRVARAVDDAAATLEADDRAFVIDRDLVYGEDGTSVRLRIATTRWVTDGEETAIVRAISREAGETVSLELEQVLASTGDLEAFAAALPSRPSVRTEAETPTPASFPSTLATVRGRLADVLDGLALPDSVQIVGGEVRVETEDTTPLLEVAYGAPQRLPPEAETILVRQAAQALGLTDPATRIVAVPLGLQPLPDSSAALRWSGLLRQYPRLRLNVRGDSTNLARVRRQLRAPDGRLTTQVGAPGARFTLADEAAP